MKKNILKGLFCVLFIAFIASCSTEDNESQQTNASAQAKSNVLHGRIGINNHGAPQLTANKALLMAQLEQLAAKNGTIVKLTNVEIVQKTATNDTTDTGYVLIGSDPDGASVAMGLDDGTGGGFYLDPSAGGGTIVVCKGCATGCNLEYLLVGKNKLYYCNSNGCGVYCTKSEFPG